MKFIRDLAERTVATYAAAFLGLLLAGGLDALNIDAAKAAAVAAIPAALTVLKAAIGSLIGEKGTAAWLPADKPSGPRPESTLPQI